MRFSPTGLLTISDGTWTVTLQGQRVSGPSQPPPPPTPRLWDDKLTQRGVRLFHANVTYGDTYWKLVRAEYRGPERMDGKHHIYVDLLDEQGRRVVNQALWAKWDGGGSTFYSEAKPGEEAAANFPMFAAGNAYRVSVAGLPSDEVAGMGLGSIEEPHMAIHVSYFLVFQRSVA